MVDGNGGWYKFPIHRVQKGYLWQYINLVVSSYSCSRPKNWELIRCQDQFTVNNILFYSALLASLGKLRYLASLFTVALSLFQAPSSSGLRNWESTTTRSYFACLSLTRHPRNLRTWTFAQRVLRPWGNGLAVIKFQNARSIWKQCRSDNLFKMDSSRAPNSNWSIYCEHNKFCIFYSFSFISWKISH